MKVAAAVVFAVIDVIFGTSDRRTTIDVADAGRGRGISSVDPPEATPAEVVYALLGNAGGGMGDARRRRR